MFKRTLTALAICVLLSLPTLAISSPNPYAKADETWIRLSGTIVAPTDDSFVLDYGDGTITVEMDDWDNYGEAYALMDGDKVTVSGRVDDSLYEATTIEAASVYVENLNTYFTANPDDEEGDFTTIWNVPVAVIETSAATVRGTVTSVQPQMRTFTIDTGERRLTVDTWSLGYNPLDDKGYQQIDSGDLVSVTGMLDADFFTGQRLEADSVITLDEAGS